MRLTDANRAALAAVRAVARRERPRHLGRIATVLEAAGADADAEALLAAASGRGDLTLNFHPDRLLADGRSVAEALLDEGVYRSQFETGISSGGLTAYPGGDRDVWVRELFAGAYQAPAVGSAERPKYGGLNLMHHLDGASPGFGSCHLRLRAATARRATYLFGDSNVHRTDVGLADEFAPVLAPLLEDIAAGRGALGCGEVGVRAFADGVLRGDLAARRGLFAPAMGHALSYIEAQVHGVVTMADDVDALVLDPAFAGTATGEALAAAAGRYGVALEWHPGFALRLDEVPQRAPDAAGGELFRWQAFCADGQAHRLAQRVVEHHCHGTQLDAASIGAAAVSVVRDPAAWADWGPPDLVLRHLKDLWRVLVAHGGPAA